MVGPDTKHRVGQKMDSKGSANLQLTVLKAHGNNIDAARGVGRPYLQILVGARGNQTASRMLFFTGSRHTEQARRYAAEMDIALFHYKLDGGMEAVNKPAAGLLKA